MSALLVDAGILRIEVRIQHGAGRQRHSLADDGAGRKLSLTGEFSIQRAGAASHGGAASIQNVARIDAGTRIGETHALPVERQRFAKTPDGGQ